MFHRSDTSSPGVTALLYGIVSDFQLVANMRMHSIYTRSFDTCMPDAKV